MVNFWAMETVPPQFRSRTLYKHNPQVTLLRTTPEECRQIGTWIGHKLNACEGQVRFLIPKNGVSASDAPGEPFFGPSAVSALVEGLPRTVQHTERRRPARPPLPAYSTHL